MLHRLPTTDLSTEDQDLTTTVPDDHRVRHGNPGTPGTGRQRSTARWARSRPDAQAREAKTGGPLTGEPADELDSTGRPRTIQDLPVESLAHIFAHLPPRSMLQCMLVCRDWNDLIRDESTWRSAFATYFGLDEADVGTAPGRRLELSSWRNEYILRTNLLARWRRPRASTTTHDPHVGAVSALYADFNPLEPYLLTVSAINGVAARSDPFSGRVSRGFAEADPNWFIGLGQPAPAAGTMEATAVELAPDGSKIVWGMRNGEVRVTSLSRTGQQRVLHSLGDVDDRHRGPVTGISFAPYPKSSSTGSRPQPAPTTSRFFATVSLDGGLRVWDVGSLVGRDVRPATCAWTSSAPLSEGAVSIAFDPGSAAEARLATVAVGTGTGAIHIWSQLDLASPSPLYARVVPPKDASGAIDALFIDSSHPPSVLAHRKGDATFLRQWPAGHSALYSSGDGDSLTVIRPCFDAPASQSTPYGKSQFVLGGDAKGSAYIWDWAATDTDPGSATILPIRVFNGRGAKITALEASPFLFFVGSVEGNVRVFDILSTATVRVFTERAAARHPARVLAAGEATEEEEARYAVSHIRATKDAVVMSIGMRVLAFRLSSASATKKRRKSAGRVAHRSDPFKDYRQIRHELEETQADLAEESASLSARRHDASRLNRIAGAPDSMTEDEAVQYAMLLSSEEAERSARFDDDSFEDELARLAFGDQVDDEDATATLRSPSGRSQSSDVSEDDRFWTSPSPSPLPSRRPSSQPFGGFGTSWRDTGARVQVSPRPSPYLYPTLYSTTPSSPPPDMSDSLWPTPSPRGGPVSRQASASTSPSSAAGPSSGKPKMSWSAAAKSASPSPVGSPSPAMTGSSSSKNKSLLTSRMRAPVEQDLDEDLKYAIELSLAEERSRQDR